MPPGILYIIGNEAAERFSFYGMKAILAVYMTKYLVEADGTSSVYAADEAKAWVHAFTSLMYGLSIGGALLADSLLGKYRTIFWLSLVYCLGHGLLAAVPGRMGLTLGLLLIAVGSGGIKPCVSAHMGDQFGPRNEGLIPQAFAWFYWAINLGACASTLATPYLLTEICPRMGWPVHYGPHLAFGLPGVLMLLATFVFWLGRNRFVHRPPAGLEGVTAAIGAEGWGILKNLLPLFTFIAVFWSLYDQTHSSWVLQAEKMNRSIGGWIPTESQIGAINPLLILILVPLFAYVVYPVVGKVVTPTPLRRIAVGFFLMVGAFSISALIQERIDRGESPAIYWQFLAYVVLTTSEVLVSTTSLEYAYLQAPARMKSIVSSAYLLSVSAGNLITALVNWFIQNTDGTSKLAGASYFWFFAGLMLVAAIFYVPWASWPKKGPSGIAHFQQGDDSVT